MRRSAISQFWPRTESAIYYETKRLAAEGLATATSERAGGRTRTVYRITEDGEEALRSWLGDPAGPMGVELESGLKMFLAGPGELDVLRSQLSELLAVESQVLDDLRAASERWSAGVMAFPERAHHTAMAADLLVRLHSATAEWAAEWLERTSDWGDVASDPQKESLARSVLESIAEAERP